MFGPGPARLLELVGSLGSLRAAAQHMGMAYTKAMRLVRDAERAFGFSLTERTVGGAHGGGSRLTPEAQDLLRRYRAFERSSRASLARSHSACFSGFDTVERLGCVVMASGRARRFGGAPGQKLVEPLLDRPVLERTIASVPTDVFDVVVVSRWEAVRTLCERLGVRCVASSRAERSGTVRAGLDALGERAGCLFVPGDQPLVRADSLRAMARAFQEAPDAIVRLSWHGEPASPILWPSDALGALRRLEGEDGGLSVLGSRGEYRDRVRLVEARDASELMDVDVPDDLARLEEALLAREEKR